MYKLPLSYYRGEDVVDLAASLLGKVLFVKTGGVLTAGRITDAEAYEGVNDRASHAWGS